MTEADAQATVDVFRPLASRLLLLSSQDVYRTYGRLHGTEPGPPVPVPVTEDGPLREKLFPHRSDPPRPSEDRYHWMDNYDKIAVERLALGQGHDWATVLRLPAVYGPHDAQHRLFPYSKRMDDGRPAILLDQQLFGWRWTRGYVENMAAAIALAVTDQRAAGRIYNVGERDALSEAEWVAAIARTVGWDGQLLAVHTANLPASMRPTVSIAQYFVADTSRIRQELGYDEVVPRDEALRLTIAWERANPPQRQAPEDFDYAAEDAVLARGVAHHQGGAPDTAAAQPGEA